MGFENVGRVWTPQTLRDYLGTLTRPDWCNAVTLHHTWAPSLAQRPNGLIAQHLVNLKNYYSGTLGWSSGPHLFVDEDQCWGMCDFRRRGVHARSFNSRAIGIEVLGNYDSESPRAGRGLQCWRTAAAATKVLLEWLGRPVNASTVLFHRDDPLTNKSCPGTRVDKDWVIGLIGGADTAPVSTTHPKPDIGVTLKASEWKFVGEQWCVPVMTYLTKKGKTADDVKKNLKKQGAKFFYGDEWLEGAFYDTESELTWAPVTELSSLVQV